jgi:hypothetical protein
LEWFSDWLGNARAHCAKLVRERRQSASACPRLHLVFENRYNSDSVSHHSEFESCPIRGTGRNRGVRSRLIRCLTRGHVQRSEAPLRLYPVRREGGTMAGTGAGRLGAVGRERVAGPSPGRDGRRSRPLRARLVDLDVVPDRRRPRDGPSFVVGQGPPDDPSFDVERVRSRDRPRRPTSGRSTATSRPRTGGRPTGRGSRSGREAVRCIRPTFGAESVRSSCACRARTSTRFDVILWSPDGPDGALGKSPSRRCEEEPRIEAADNARLNKRFPALRGRVRVP